MFNPENKQDLNRLRQAVEWSRRRLRPFRENYRDFIKEFVGSHYSENGSHNDLMINLLQQAVETTVMQLVPQRPQVTISTDFSEYRTVAYDFEIAMNDELEKMEIERVLSEVAMDSWFSCGIVKVSLAQGNIVNIDGEQIDIGDLHVKSIAMSNWVHDVAARRWEECDYYGDLYRVPVDALKESGLYENIDSLGHSEIDHPYDEEGVERPHDITSDGEYHDDTTYVKYVELWDIFLPKEQLLITLPKTHSESSGPPLRIVEWDGPPHGPYHMLGLSDVPENIMPLSPAANLIELHTLANNLIRKLEDQAGRQKTVTLVNPGAEKDGETIRDAADGDMISVNNPKDINEVRFGGVDSQNHGFAMWTMNQFDRHAGGLNAMAGLSPSADTLGQEQILQGNSSSRIEKQKSKVRNFMMKVVKDVAWYRWHDQFYDPKIVKKIPNTSIQVAGSFHPENRLGDFLSYNFDIEPYSLEYMPPSAKSARLQQIIAQLILPMMPMMEQQGISLNMESMIKMIARHGALPELVEMISFANGETIPGPTPMSKDRPLQSPSTTRTNVRLNGGSQSDDEQMAISLMSQQPQTAN